MAIKAMREMLDVINAAREFLDEWMTTGSIDDMEEEDQASFWDLFHMMKRLDKKHGEGFINE